ncbi:cadherin-like domain-containing protein [Vibrio panuliri]|uniref:Cadherin-like domain-containing protein n=1 Tax=Vibrio panuliri TaxID=1381081 RepID=A0ABX3FVT8_9VIBR|nr:cadherin-like domain-containing protein [Vibrio panuliri]KAB1454442.1 calcium-binding protein [Vibrio panuliri]OLQ96573.1 hypothetical protein BIY20_18585 [Vibrio panuliri]
MGIANLLTAVSSAGGQSIVIGVDGTVRLLKAGEKPLPGELVINLSNQDPLNNTPIAIEQVDQQGDALDVTQQVDDIIAAIEQGEDPTLADPELAPAAGEVLGSSLAASGTVVRDGAESQPETLFVTEASNTLNLSRTQSLELESLLFSDGTSPALVLPPIAVDDPVGYSVSFGNMTSEIASGSQGWNGADISASFNGQTVNALPEYMDRLAVTGTDIPGGPGHQLQYDRNTQQSEKLSIKFDQAVTQGRFAITNLYSDEGEKPASGEQNNEVGVWIAYLDGVVAASGSFEGVSGGGKAFFDIDTQGNAFDEIVFMANEYSLGVQNDTTNDSSDYFVAGIEVSSPGHYAVNQDQELTISVAEILQNDSDPDGTIVNLIQLLDGNSNGTARLEGDNIIFKPNPGWSGNTQLEYQIVDADGQTDNAFISIVVNKTPSSAIVESVEMLDDTVYEGESLIYTVTLDKPTLSTTDYEFSFKLLDDPLGSDVKLDQLSFTNGVTVSADGKLIVPEGVAKFDVVLPTIIDLENDSGERVELTIFNTDTNGNTTEQSSTGTILDIDVGYELTQGDVTTAGDDPYAWVYDNVSASYDGNDAHAYINSNTGRIGIIDGPQDGGPTNQIQYDRQSGQSEKLSIKLDSPATSGRFVISRLFANEGEGENNHESGTWVAKLNGESVASGSFDGEGLYRGDRNSFDIDTNGFAFDEIVFSANEYSAGLQGDQEIDSSDYFVEGLHVSASNEFTIQKSAQASDMTQLEIPAAHIFNKLANSNPDTLSLTNASLTNPQAGQVTIQNGMLIFTAAVGFVGETHLKFEVTEADGSLRYGVLDIKVADTVASSEVQAITAEETFVPEGEQLHFSIQLDKVTLDDTLFDVSLLSKPVGAGVETDILSELANASFTNGVKFHLNADGSGSFEVPESVAEFEVYIPVALDTTNNGMRDVTLTVANVESEVSVVDQYHSVTLANDILTADDGMDLFKWVDQPYPDDKSFTVDGFEPGRDKLDLSDLFDDNVQFDDILAAVQVTPSNNSSEVELEFETKHAGTMTINVESHDPLVAFDTQSSDALLKELLISLPD